VTHRGADWLSEAIDSWPARGGAGVAHLQDVLEALAGELPSMSDAPARERVRRRLATITPTARTPQVLLIERAADEFERLQNRIRQDGYVPWPAVVGTAALVAGAVGLAIWLRRRGIDSPIAEA